MSDEVKTVKHTTAESVANTFEWLITAFVLAFVFRAFVLEAFRIPTGSMADTLMGDHFQICCTECGYRYEYNFNPYIAKNYKTAAGQGLYRLWPSPRCPSCGYYENPSTLVPKSNGDRILVFKCLYQFIEPRRWDVIVFKCPTEPGTNYIKRLIGKPGETIEIIDGDIYINNVLQRKPDTVQDEVWMCVYDNAYQPVRKMENRFNGHSWHQPFTNDTDSQWKYNPQEPTKFTLAASAEKTNIMFYDTTKGNNFRAAYGYGDPRYYDNIPYCSDLMMKYYARFDAGQSSVGIGLKKYETLYKAYVNSTGEMIIEKVDTAGKTLELARGKTSLPVEGKSFFVKFANVDHQLVFEVEKEKLVYDMGTNKDDAGQRLAEIEPKALIFGTGSLTLNDVALYRDINYLSIRPDNRQPVDRAGEGNPFTLGKDEFFAMGDNSPDSADSRLWSIEGIGNNGTSYRMGIVPRDYLVGKAFFVYWPSSFRLEKLKLGIVPDIGKLRFIYGGKN
ncbi:MAG: signal peptidase I [Phycisphaerae bacterium]|jgi:signal peptidase I